MGEKERSGLKKLMDVAYFIALKGRPFTDFKDLIELEKLHDVKFDTSAYENESACRDFIKSTASYLFDIDVRKKLTRVNFIAILVDGTTDRAVTEQEVLYVMYVDPDTHKPTLLKLWRWMISTKLLWECWTPSNLHSKDTIYPKCGTN